MRLERSTWGWGRNIEVPLSSHSIEERWVTVLEKARAVSSEMVGIEYRLWCENSREAVCVGPWDCTSKTMRPLESSGSRTCRYWSKGAKERPRTASAPEECSEPPDERTRQFWKEGMHHQRMRLTIHPPSCAVDGMGDDSSLLLLLDADSCALNC